MSRPLPTRDDSLRALATAAAETFVAACRAHAATRQHALALVGRALHLDARVGGGFCITSEAPLRGVSFFVRDATAHMELVGFSGDERGLTPERMSWTPDLPVEQLKERAAAWVESAIALLVAGGAWRT